MHMAELKEELQGRLTTLYPHPGLIAAVISIVSLYTVRNKK